MVAADTTVEAATVADTTAAGAESMAAARSVIHADSSVVEHVAAPLAGSAAELVVVSTAGAECMAVDTGKIESS